MILTFTNRTRVTSDGGRHENVLRYKENDY